MRTSEGWIYTLITLPIVSPPAEPHHFRVGIYRGNVNDTVLEEFQLREGYKKHNERGFYDTRPLDSIAEELMRPYGGSYADGREGIAVVIQFPFAAYNEVYAAIHSKPREKKGIIRVPSPHP